MKGTMFLMALCFSAVAYAIPPDQTYIACDADNACPDQMQCVKFEDMETPVCWPADQDPCEYCAGAECAVAESYPPQVTCGDVEVPDTDPVPCVTDFDCPEGDMCFNGYCVYAGDPETETTCENEAGYCVIGDTFGYCQCVTGAGVGWGEAEPGEPTDPDTDDGSDGDGEVPPTPYFMPTNDECMAKLIENCGETAPDLKEECGAELFDACLDAVEWVEGTCFETTLTEEQRNAIAKGEWVGDWSLMVYQCCQETTVDEIADDLGELKECVETDGCDECLGGGDDPMPSTPCVENGDCPDGGTCKEGTCYWTTESGDETTTNPSDQPKDETGDEQTGGEDYTNTTGDGAETAGAPKESGGSACSLVLI